ncbi:MAG: TIGR01906 family membrane protein [Christensenellales bacterium]|jgi:integral membrane protein (TIGR01906 family)
MKRVLADISAVLASILLIIAILILSIEAFAINPHFFQNEYQKLDTAQSIGMSEEDLSVVTRGLLGYTTGSRDSLDMKAAIGGQYREVFGTREKDHMIDVKALYMGSRTLRIVSLAGAAFFIIIAFILKGKKTVRTLCRSFLSVSGAFVIVVAAIGIYAAINFTAFWASFHHVFFSNDLWKLDPRTDVLIMMVPERFFSDLVARIIIRFISIFTVLNVAAFMGTILYKKTQKRKTAKEAN